jgi:hypothetical protein
MEQPISSRGTRLRIVAAATTGNALGVTATVHAPFGLFLIPLSTQFGWHRAAISAVLGFIALAGAIIYPIAGRWADARGSRGILIAGNTLLAFGIASLALSNGSLALFYASFAFIAVVGSLNNTAIYSKLVSDWFSARRGTMLGITAGAGNGIGATLVPALAAILLSAYGWRVAYLGIAGVLLLIGLPVLAFGVREAPRHAEAEDAGGTADGLSLGQAAHTPVFWLLLAAIAAGAGCTTAIFSHVVPILAERGVGVGVGTSVLGVFAMVTAGWQILLGGILDRVAGPRIVAPAYGFAALGLALVEFGTGTPALLAGGTLLGIGLGTQFGALPFLVARYFGLRCFGTVIGAMYSAVVLAQGVTPILLDHAFDVQGTYRLAVEIVCLCLVAGAGLLLLLPPYARRAAVPSGITVAHP